jgi:hypothetical protein
MLLQLLTFFLQLCFFLDVYMNDLNLLFCNLSVELCTHLKPTVSESKSGPRLISLASFANKRALSTNLTSCRSLLLPLYTTMGANLSKALGKLQ